MKTIPGALATHIAQDCTTLARMWKIIRTDGVALYFTSHDQDILFSGNTYISKAGFSPTAIDSKSDLSVDNLDVAGVFDDANITERDLRAGAFDYADVYIFLVNWANPAAGAINLRRGKLGETMSSPQGYYKTEIRGLSQLLQQFIVERYGPACRADVFDSRCALQKSLYECTATVTSVVDATRFLVTLNTTPSAPFYSATSDGWFQYGVLQFTGGNNNGRALEIKSWNHTTGQIELYVPAGYPVVGGDTLKLLPGCDKSLATCRDKFSNLLNMRAESYLPGNDAVFIYPDSGGGGL